MGGCEGVTDGLPSVCVGGCGVTCGSSFNCVGGCEGVSGDSEDEFTDGFS